MTDGKCLGERNARYGRVERKHIMEWDGKREEILDSGVVHSGRKD